MVAGNGKGWRWEAWSVPSLRSQNWNNECCIMRSRMWVSLWYAAHVEVSWVEKSKNCWLRWTYWFPNQILISEEKGRKSERNISHVLMSFEEVEIGPCVQQIVVRWFKLWHLVFFLFLKLYLFRKIWIWIHLNFLMSKWNCILIAFSVRWGILSLCSPDFAYMVWHLKIHITVFWVLKSYTYSLKIILDIYTVL